MDMHTYVPEVSARLDIPFLASCALMQAAATRINALIITCFFFHSFCNKMWAVVLFCFFYYFQALQNESMYVPLKYNTSGWLALYSAGIPLKTVPRTAWTNSQNISTEMIIIFSCLHASIATSSSHQVGIVLQTWPSMLLVPIVHSCWLLLPGYGFSSPTGWADKLCL